MNTATLTQFYRELYQWIQAGCPKNNKYGWDAKVGICTNSLRVSYTLRKEVGEQFQEAFPENPTYPFNKAEDQYWLEQNKYTNPARLEWIIKHCNYSPVKKIPTYDSFESMRSDCRNHSHAPTVARIQRPISDKLWYVCIGTQYGYIHTSGGSVRVWESYSGARRFLTKYLKD